MAYPPFLRQPMTLLAVGMFLSACGTTPVPTINPEAVGELYPGSGYLLGYLADSARPDSLALLSAPPQDGTPAKEADRAAYRTLIALQSTPRGDLARRDANLTFPKAAETFSCALGVDISAQETPHLMMLLRRVLADASRSTSEAKRHYQRKRPFVEFGDGTCTPEHEAALANNGSYPSGHSSLGWAWGLVLAEVKPERSDALVQRGLSVGQSRGICGVHWQSDIVAGQQLGAAVVARLHSNATFQAQLALAREEARRAKAPDANVCAAEAAALAIQ